MNQQKEQTAPPENKLAAGLKTGNAVSPPCGWKHQVHDVFQYMLCNVVSLKRSGRGVGGIDMKSQYETQRSPFFSRKLQIDAFMIWKIQINK